MKGISEKNKEVLYQFKIDRKLWEEFQAYLRKIYWRENLSLDKGIIRLIKKFIEESKIENAEINT